MSKKVTSWKAYQLADYLDGRWEIPPKDLDWSAYLFTTLQLTKLNRTFPDMNEHVAVVTSEKGVTEWFSDLPKAFIVGEDVDFPTDERPVLRVKDPQDTLFKLAKMGRIGLKVGNGKMIAITGSVGKTSVKELLASVLGNFAEVVNTRSSLNGLTEIQWALSACITQPDYAVIEVCENVLAGRKTETKNLLSPHVSIITQVSLAHADEIRVVNNDRDMAQLLCKIFDDMKHGGIVLLNREMSHFDLVHEHVIKQGVTPVSYGISITSQERVADVYIKSIRANENGKDGITVSVNIYGREISFNRPTYSTGMALNALAVLTCIYHLGFDITAAAKYISNVPGVKSREDSHVIEILPDKGNITIVDDCYNAQPLSVLESLNTLNFRDIDSGGRKIFVVGDVTVYKDPRYVAGYLSFVLPLQRANFDKIYFVGTDISRLAEVLPSEKVGGIYENQEEALEALSDELAPSDLCMLKVTSGGDLSNNMALKLIKILKEKHSIT